MKIFGIVGKSGNGKTTLLEKLLPVLCERGLSVSTIKHTHHQFDIDKPGKDSYRHREAGASEVMLASSQRWALLHENRDQDEPEIEELVSHMSEVDLVLVEGFKNHVYPKIEIHRPDHGRKPLWPNDPTILAVASDAKVELDGIDVINLNDVTAIAEFILDYLHLNSAEKKT